MSLDSLPKFVWDPLCGEAISDKVSRRETHDTAVEWGIRVRFNPVGDEEPANVDSPVSQIAILLGELSCGRELSSG